jgi:hypothetical protein
MVWLHPQRSIDISDILLTQSTRAASLFFFDQAAKPVVFKSTHPVGYGSWGITEQIRGLATAHALGYQQDPVKTVIISRFLGPTDLILQSQNYGFSILYR